MLQSKGVDFPDGRFGAIIKLSGRKEGEKEGKEKGRGERRDKSLRTNVILRRKGEVSRDLWWCSHPSAVPPLPSTTHAKNFPHLDMSPVGPTTKKWHNHSVDLPHR